MPTRRGSIRLFRIAGLNVYLHWSWFVVALFAVAARRGIYASPAFNVLEYLALFLIVLLHECGHALACRSVGGRADEIVLWPLGGVAYVQPPLRPGPTLWSIVAGPLVNVVIAGVLFAYGSFIGLPLGELPAQPSDSALFIQAVWYLNFGLLVFNLLPVYPLDGGQILQSLLWFILGRARSLMAASLLGFLGVAYFFYVAWVRGNAWLGIVALFILATCWQGFLNARHLVRAGRGPRRPGAMCPGCQTAPPVGQWWTCSACGRPFDVFAGEAVCPNCGTRFTGARCLNCGETHPMSEWHVSNPPLRDARSD